MTEEEARERLLARRETLDAEQGAFELSGKAPG